jgi:hypothetical protein
MLVGGRFFLPLLSPGTLVTSHTLMRLSAPPVARYLPSGENSMHHTLPAWPSVACGGRWDSCTKSENSAVRERSEREGEGERWRLAW